ncbi:MAG TPA: glutamine--fructose-6-phosphate transaminase (isomerizing) [Actinomycetota bacterium]|nr:glutamine--fructose-6-phosphate transaminase (isomerizing) [Actinomycetota bacterium]
MCGIVGYIGPKPALPVILGGLSTLEYRGYDSSGVALVGDDGLQVVRRAGMLANLKEATVSISDHQTLGIGHTRWATCGPPTEKNAHPHVDCTGRIALVHNGIIENHQELRERLEAEGHAFTSDTDTETIVHLVESHLSKESSLREAVGRAAAELVGSFALAVVSADHPEVMVAARMDAPLLVGLGEGEAFIASDVVALIQYTRQIIAIPDGHLVEVTRGTSKIFDLDGVEHAPKIEEVTWDIAAAEKGGYADFMLKEIHEQPSAIRETLRGRWDRSGRLILDELRLSEDEVRSVDKVFVVACGSSYHAGLVAKYAIEHWTRLPVEIDVASEFRYRDPVLDSNTLVVAISQSGETADTLAAVRYAKRQGAKVISISNVVGSSITRHSDAVLYTHAGPEVGVAATKTLTTQMTALWLLALWIAQVTGTKYPQESGVALQELVQIPKKMAELLADDSAIREVAKRHEATGTFLFIGRGVGFPVALEGALKLKEISYLHAEGFPAGEMKHGPIALIEPGVPVIAVATKSHIQAKLLSNVEEAKARGATIVMLTNPGDEAAASLADMVVEVPTTDELLSPILDVIPLQLLSYHVAKQRGLDPDKPRNLAKSVTVE